jgi:hypothetical protein
MEVGTMPMSNPWHLPAVLQFVQQLQARSVLDIGVGLGTYGFMVRQFADIACGRLRRDEWLVKIDGIEIFEPYRNPVWDYAYDAVRIGDVRDMLGSTGPYDVILCNDVLEHFPKQEAVDLIERLLDHAPVVIATTPASDWPQGPWGGNDAETHHCTLAPADIPHLAAVLHTGVTNCYLISKTPEKTALIGGIAWNCPLVAPSPRESAPGPGLRARLAHRMRAVRKALFG